jgi:hypothetical protein
VLLLIPGLVHAEDWSTLFTAQDVRDRLSTAEGRQEALDFCHRLNISKVYVEVFRDGYQPDQQTLKTARDFFRESGLKVSGCVTTTGLGKPSSGWNVAACYTNRGNQERLSEVFRTAAKLFDEVMIDDFFFTDCQCSECAAAKGNLSWEQYRDKLMVEMARDHVLAPARAVNPQVKVILKFPQWYDAFQDRGYVVDEETRLFDRVWVGTELRDPSSDEWGHKQQYTGYFIYRWLKGIGQEKTGGGWFDPYGTNPVNYLDQALITILAGAPETFLFHYGELNSPECKGQIDALAAHRASLDKLSSLVGKWEGIPTYKPISSEPGSEAYIFDEIGMLGIPLLPTAEFPEKSRVALFTTHVLKDTQFVPKLLAFLKASGTAFLSEGLAHELTADPRLPSTTSLNLAKGQFLRTVPEGEGKLIIFSDALPKLAYVDSQNRVAQPTAAEWDALHALRKEVEQFTPTSIDAPPRVAVFPLGGKVAVANFTELPVACHLTGLGGMVSRFNQVYEFGGASLASDRTTLRIPPHGMIMVEQ